MLKLLKLLLLVLLPAAAHAQATDVILRTDGQEVAGRVLSISPLEVRYLPATSSADTLRLAATDVFLIRYANGTRELLQAARFGKSTAPAAATDLLPGLSPEERRALGRRDAVRHYRGSSVFWGSAGATLYGGPLLGLVAPAVIAPSTIRQANLNAPEPGLLSDPAYNGAYREEAQRRKRGQAWGGYGLGAAAWVFLIVSLVNLN